MRDRFIVGMWVFAGVMWTVFGLLYLFRLHLLFFGVSYLVLGAGSFFIALRYKRKHFPKLPLA
jgi:hypothetical protein